MLAASAPRLMTQWIDDRGFIVAKVSQQLAYGPKGGVATVYIAEVFEEASPCQRYACAVEKVRAYLNRKRIRATAQMV